MKLIFSIILGLLINLSYSQETIDTFKSGKVYEQINPPNCQSEECWESPCPNDDCGDALQITLTPDNLCNGITFTEHRFCNCNCTYGNFWVNPGTPQQYVETQGCPEYGNGPNNECASEEFDFWVRLEILIPGTYTINMTSDYQTCYLENDGVQFFLYDANVICEDIAFCDGGIGQTPLLLGYPCVDSEDPWQQSFDFTVNLTEIGYYYLQIDGWSTSRGCVNLKMCNSEPLSIIEFDIDKTQLGYPMFKTNISQTYVIERSSSLDKWELVPNPDITLEENGVYYYRVRSNNFISEVKPFIYLLQRDGYWFNYYDTLGRKIK